VAGVDNLLVRFRGIDLRTVDLVVALCLAAGAIAAVANAGHAGVVPLAAAVIATAPVATRRRAPVASVAFMAAGTILLSRTDSALGDETLEGLAALLGFYALGRTATMRGSALIDVAALAAGAVACALSPHQSTVVDVVAAWGLFIAGPYVGGRTAENRGALTRELKANAERLRREQETRARSAAAEERTRIARELHDVIAHSVSVMVIQTAAARRVAPGDRDAARRALASVQGSGREALLELRRMIGVLRHGDLELAGAAAPGLGQLDLLVQRARQAGLPVELQMNGRRRTLPESLDLVAFRVVQEALTNAIKHAGPARASVTVTFTPSSLELEICDDGRGDAASELAGEGGGHGLVGMRERLMLYGGELSASHRHDGGFRVHARVPVDEERAA
jgi:signal transduction histidine kinase